MISNMLNFTKKEHELFADFCSRVDNHFQHYYESLHHDVGFNTLEVLSRLVWLDGTIALF
jgi:hypothetical protein